MVVIKIITLNTPIAPNNVVIKQFIMIDVMINVQVELLIHFLILYVDILIVKERINIIIILKMLV